MPATGTIFNQRGWHAPSFDASLFSLSNRRKPLKPSRSTRRTNIILGRRKYAPQAQPPIREYNLSSFFHHHVRIRFPIYCSTAKCLAKPRRRLIKTPSYRRHDAKEQKEKVVSPDRLEAPQSPSLTSRTQNRSILSLSLGCSVRVFRINEKTDLKYRIEN